MSEQDQPAGEQAIRIFTDATTLGAFLSKQGTYRYEREDGTTVHGDAGGEWTLDENGDADIAFFMSPLHLMKLRQRGLVEDGTADGASEEE